MSSRFSLSLSRSVLIGRPGWPPGNSQRDGAAAPMVAWPLRVAMTLRASSSTGWGQADGCTAEADADWVIGDRDLVGGQQSDGRRALGIEEQQAGEAVLGVDRSVV
jgi:hypothetical protein